MGSHKREICILTIVLIVVLALVSGLPFYLGGKTVTGGNNPTPELTDSVTCESSEIIYPFVSAQEGEVGHNVTIKMIFQSNELSSLGFYYTVHYHNNEVAQSAYDIMNAELNINLARAGLIDGRDLDVGYNKNQNDIGLSIYFNKDNVMDDVLMQFVMLDGGDGIPVEKFDFISGYEAKGFICV